jgi:hypothetical protein
MTTLSRRVILSGMAGFAAAAPVRDARAAIYPERPITLIVPFAPGGSTDILARIVAEHLYQCRYRNVIGNELGNTVEVRPRHEMIEDIDDHGRPLRPAFGIRRAEFSDIVERRSNDSGIFAER